MVLERQKHSIEDFTAFLSEQEDDRRYELIDGEIVEMAPPTNRNSEIAAKLIILIGSYVYQNNLGYMQSSDGGYVLSPGTVRIPDCSFIVKDRFPEGLPEGIVDGGPDLAVEVISASETAFAISKKVRMYLDAGTRLVWIVFPTENTVDVYRPAETGYHLQSYGLEDDLSGEDILPGFSLPVKSILA
jgi:Uma2 family endonuclease